MNTEKLREQASELLTLANRLEKVKALVGEFQELAAAEGDQTAWYAYTDAADRLEKALAGEQ